MEHTLSLGGKGFRWSRQPRKQGRQGDLVGRASLCSTARPVRGQRHLLQEQKWVCHSQDKSPGQGHWPTQRAVFKLRLRSASYLIVSPGDLPAAEGGSKEHRGGLSGNRRPTRTEKLWLLLLRQGMMNTHSFLGASLHICPQSKQE